MLQFFLFLVHIGLFEITKQTSYDWKDKTWSSSLLVKRHHACLQKNFIYCDFHSLACCHLNCKREIFLNLCLFFLSISSINFLVWEQSFTLMLLVFKTCFNIYKTNFHSRVITDDWNMFSINQVYQSCILSFCVSAPKELWPKFQWVCVNVLCSVIPTKKKKRFAFFIPIVSQLVPISHSLVK